MSIAHRDQKISLILAWEEQGGHIPEKTAQKIEAIDKAYASLTGKLAGLGFKGKKLERMQQSLTNVHAEMEAETAKNTVEGEMLGRTFDDQKKRSEAVSKSISKLSYQLGRLGVRMGWMGYRMVTIGRLLLRWVQIPINKILRSLTDWQQSMYNIALALGLMTYYGLGSESMLSQLRDTILQLPEAGLKVQAAFGALEGLFAAIAVDVAPLLSEAVIELVGVLLDLWTEIKPTVIPMLQTLADELLPRLLNIIEEVGAETAINFITALAEVARLFVDILDILSPLMPLFGKLLGYAVGLSPVLVIAGTALFMFSLPLQALSAILVIFNPLISALAVKLGLVAAPAGAATASIWALEVAAGVTLGTITSLALGIAAVALAATMLDQAFKQRLLPSLELDAELDKLITGGGRTVDVLDDITDRLGIMCFSHATPMAKTFTEALIVAREETQALDDDLRKLSVSLGDVPRVGTPGSFGPGAGGVAGAGLAGQEVFIENTFTIGSISADIDVERLKDEVSTRIARDLRNRRLR
jgi:hypothetical protein